MTIFRDKVVTENWNRPYMMGHISLENLKPHPKNPTIANFFKQLGWVEELGSGVRKMYKYCPIYMPGAMPDIEEGDVFKLTIPYDDGVNLEDGGVNGGVNLEDGGVSGGVKNIESAILNAIQVNEGLSALEISKIVDKSQRTTERYLNKLKKAGLIEFRGAPKTGGYYITQE